MSINILKYESDVWRTADLLIGAGIKQSDFPKYMMLISPCSWSKVDY